MGKEQRGAEESWCITLLLGFELPYSSFLFTLHSEGFWRSHLFPWTLIQGKRARKPSER